jgi:hypothetical protein
MAQTMHMEVCSSGQQIDYRPLARHLLEKITAAYQDPAFEKRYRAWARSRGIDPLDSESVLSRIPDEVLEDAEAYRQALKACCM